MYDFDTIIERRGTGAVKWDARPPFDADTSDMIPLWVADMDFKAAPFIIDALRRRVEHGVFGYVTVPDSTSEAVVSWFSRKHGWTLEKDWIIYTTGVVPALSAVIKALCEPGEKVIIQSPVYNCFFSSIRNNGCEVLDVPLVYGEGTYSFDFEGLERACSDPEAKVLLLCNPHNPAGRVWTRAELARVGETARRHGVAVVSDEIHCEIVMPGHEYTPFASLTPADQACCVTLCSPSKSFNIAGLHLACIVTPDAERRRLIDRAININEICDVNPFGVVALEAAYSPEGEVWLSELNQYIYDNYRLLLKELSGYPVCTLEGTYLAWVDISDLGIPSKELVEILLRDWKVWVNAGTMYGTDGFIRINLATPRALLTEGLSRLRRGLAALHRSPSSTRSR